MRLLLIAVLVGAGVVAGGTGARAAAQVGDGGTTNGGVLRPFDYHGVRLTDGPFARQQREILEFYLAVPTEDYLHGFRVRAGKAAPGKELGGWYSSDTFNAFGQIVSGLARFYAATGDERARAKVNAMVEGFVDCIEPDGYHFYSRKTNAPHYEFDKFLCGLLDAHLYCGNERALGAASRITDWAIKNLDPNPKYPQPKGTPNVEGYTLTENLYRAYLVTGDPKYRDFGKHWEYWGWWDKFETTAPKELFVQPGGNVVRFYHAYSHVNSLSGLGAGYQVTSDTKYLVRLKNAFDWMRANQTYVTGGYGPMERIISREFMEEALKTSDHHFETQCGSWAALKVSKYLEGLTGDARYAGWAEQMVYNGIGGTRPMDADGGVQYFSDYSLKGGRKVNSHKWSCCSGTRPQAAADYTDQVYFHDDRDVYVSLFLPSTLEWNRAGSTVSLEMATKFPAEDVVRLTVKEAPAEELAVNVRRPDWLAGEPEVRVNGERVTAGIGGGGGAGAGVAEDRHWMRVERRWRAGDVVEVRLPMELKWNRFDEAREFPGALTYGPVVLAWEAGSKSGNPAAGRGAQELVGKLRREGSELVWRLEGDGADDVTVRPWYAVAPVARYFVYLDPGAMVGEGK